MRTKKEAPSPENFHQCLCLYIVLLHRIGRSYHTEHEGRVSHFHEISNFSRDLLYSIGVLYLACKMSIMPR